MGAGSAKGVQPEENEDEVDTFSSASSDHWENEEDIPAPTAPPAPQNPPKPTDKPESTPSQPPSVPPPTTSVVQIENGESAEDKKEKPKKKFGFSLRRDQSHTDRVNDVHNESSDEEESKEEKKGGGGGGRNKEKRGGGFRLFGWRKEEKKSEKDEALDQDIDDLERTFDSLGIVGKNMWGGEGGDGAPKQKENGTDDVILSPMRKRGHVKGRGGGGGVKGVSVNGGAQSGGSNASKRTFRFSWETDKQKPPTRDEDEWEYKAVVIEGFDIEKFRKANLKESVFDSNSLPNVVGDEEEFGGGGGGGGGRGGSNNSKSSPLRYDQTEQYILASIERDFTN